MGRNGLATVTGIPGLLAVSVVVSVLTVRFLPEFVPGYNITALLWRSFLALYLLKALWDSVIYPELLSPIRNVPGPKSWTGADGVLFEQPRGLCCLRWMKDIPNNGFIRTRSFDGTQFLLVTSPEVFADILVHRSYEFEKPGVVRKFLARILGWGLIASESDQHRIQRKALTPAFNVKNIRELYPLMWEKSELLASMLASEVKRAPAYPTGDEGENPQSQIGELNICEWTSRLTLDIIGPAAMGRDFRTLQNENDTVAKNYLEIFQPSIRRMLYFVLSISTPSWFAERWPSSTNESLKRTVKTIRGVCSDIVREKKEEITNKGNVDSFDILSSMLRGKEISDDACVDQMLTFLAAGHETTANALAWTCFLLCKHPDVQTALRTELRENLDPSAPITAAAIDSLPLLCGVCNEVLRLYPTVPITVREVMEDTELGGIMVPRETWLLLCPWATNRDPALWGSDSESFVPERWIDVGEDGARRPNNSGGASSNYAMLTFLHGPRSCIGQGFARAELRCAVAAIVGRFGMKLQRPEEEVKSVGAVTTKPKDGINLRLRVLDEWAERLE